MQSSVNQIHKLLIKKRKTVAVAESCTGGLTSCLFTYISGSSRYFILGLVAYSNKAKEKLLKIPPSLISQHGAVSETVAARMAQSVRKIAGTDFGIGITGIAGPTGGTRKKPIGTVFIALANKNKTICKKFIFKGNRAQIRKESALKALESLKTLIINDQIPMSK